MSSFTLIEIPKQLESDDPQELAEQARELLEDYKRAPWTGLSLHAKIAKVKRAAECIARILEMEPSGSDAQRR